MNDIKQMAAITTLNSMMQGGYVSICTIDKIAAMLGINPKCEAHEVLSTIHCVHFDKMPSELRDAIPGLIEKCLSMAPTFQFESAEKPSAGIRQLLIDVTPKPPRRRLLSFIAGTKP